jgi:hypothetical protein
MTSQATAAPAAEKRDMPMQLREAQIMPATFNDADNTVECVWTTGAQVRRYDYWNDTDYDEALSLDAGAVDMSRFDAGAVPVLDSHRSYGGIGAQLGIVASAQVQNGKGTAVLRLSQRPDLAGVVQDIKAGIIRNISVGYAVNKYQVTPANARDDGGTVPLYTAVDWTPMELSFVTIPADVDAGTRAHQQRSQAVRPCEFIRAAAQSTQEQTMSNPQGGTNPTPANPQPSDEAARAAAEAQAREAAAAAERERSAEITALCKRFNITDKAETFIRENKTVQQVKDFILEQRAQEDATPRHPNVRGIHTTQDAVETQMRGLEEAILHRIDARTKITDNGRQFRGMSLLELGREFLESRGVSTRGMDRMTLAARMLHFRDDRQFRSAIMQERDGAGYMVTADFASLLANVANKRLRNVYEENPGTYTRWARRAPNAPDFKSMSVIQLSAMPDLLQTNEAGEFKYGALSDGAETYSLLTYGRIVALSRQAIINDDLRGFDRILAGFGGSAARLENRTVYAQLTANANMADGHALFDNTNHGNYGTGAGSALQASALATARTAMRKQKGLQKEELNLVPTTLIVPAALEQTAYQLTSANYTPTKQSDVSEFRSGGRTALDPVVEPVLDAASATAWYLAASNGQVDTVEYCWLDGAEGPMVDTQVGFEVDGIQFKCREDFAAKVIDYRGLYLAAGA